MNKELYMVFIPAISWALFALGGTQISPTIPGWKGWRRFILPTIYLVAVLLAKIVWWKALLVAIIAGASYSLGYSPQRNPWWRIALVGVAYALISAPIGLSAWNGATAIGFSVLFILANWEPTKDVFIWKVTEGFFGLLCGIQLAYLIMGYGLLW